MRISEFIEKSNQAASTEELFDLFARAVKPFGPDLLAFGALTPAAQKKFISEERPAPAVALNYPEDWIKYYFEKQFFNGTDFVVALTPTLRKPYLWNDLQETVGLEADQMTFLNESQDAKLHNGASVPIYGPAGEAYVVSYASSQPNPDMESHMPVLRTLAYQFYSAFGDLAGLEDVIPSIKLTSRELECLTWAAEGKSAWVTGEILSISHETVTTHLKHAMTKFGTTNKTIAIVKALRAGLISPNL